MEVIIIHPQNKEQANLFEQLAIKLKVPFEKKARKNPAIIILNLKKNEGEP
ncbi:MAG: DUF2683 family protein [Ginsengibacter sp.]